MASITNVPSEEVGAVHGSHNIFPFIISTFCLELLETNGNINFKDAPNFGEISFIIFDWCNNDSNNFSSCSLGVDCINGR